MMQEITKPQKIKIRTDISSINYNTKKNKMRGIKTLAIIMLVTWGSYAQSDIKFSVYSSLDFSKGFEIRGDFEDWYMAFQLESFLKNKETFLNWGGSIGIIKEVNSFDYLGGIRAGFMIVDKQSKPSFGLEAEVDYNINENVFIGLRCAYDACLHSPDVETPTSKKMLRGFIKIGLKF